MRERVHVLNIVTWTSKKAQDSRMIDRNAPRLNIPGNGWQLANQFDKGPSSFPPPRASLDPPKNNFSPFVSCCLLSPGTCPGIICFIQRPVKSFEVIPRRLMEEMLNRNGREHSMPRQYNRRAGRLSVNESWMKRWQSNVSGRNKMRWVEGEENKKRRKNGPRERERELGERFSN